jgi:hypothetical protein
VPYCHGDEDEHLTVRGRVVDAVDGTQIKYSGLRHGSADEFLHLCDDTIDAGDAAGGKCIEFGGFYGALVDNWMTLSRQRSWMDVGS